MQLCEILQIDDTDEVLSSKLNIFRNAFDSDLAEFPGTFLFPKECVIATMLRHFSLLGRAKIVSFVLLCA